MHTRRSLTGAVALGSALVLLGLGVGGEAEAARNARATGFYRVQQGFLGLPNQLFLTEPGWTNALGFPNGDPVVSGRVSLMGQSPASIVLPQFAASGAYTGALALMGGLIRQVATSLSFRAPAAVGGALFTPTGGPGTFSFCPDAAGGPPGAACPVVTTITMMMGMMYTMTFPDLAAPPQGTHFYNGRVVYLAGGGGFGGISQVLLAGQYDVSRPLISFPIVQLIHYDQLGASPRAVGGNGVFGSAPLDNAYVTQPKQTTSFVPITQPGPFVTQGSYLTSCPSTSMGGAYPNIPLTGPNACQAASGPLLRVSSRSSRQTGFAFTTGTVLAQQTTNPLVSQLLTVSGSDSRTPQGIGNITLVAGGLIRRDNRATAVAHRIELTISEQTRSISAPGLAAGALLMLQVAGYGLRGRL